MEIRVSSVQTEVTGRHEIQMEELATQTKNGGNLELEEHVPALLSPTTDRIMTEFNADQKRNNEAVLQSSKRDLEAVRYTVLQSCEPGLLGMLDQTNGRGYGPPGSWRSPTGRLKKHDKKSPMRFRFVFRTISVRGSYDFGSWFVRSVRGSVRFHY